MARVINSRIEEIETGSDLFIRRTFDPDIGLYSKAFAFTRKLNRFFVSWRLHSYRIHRFTVLGVRVANFSLGRIQLKKIYIHQSTVPSGQGEILFRGLGFPANYCDRATVTGISGNTLYIYTEAQTSADSVCLHTCLSIYIRVHLCSIYAPV